MRRLHRSKNRQAESRFWQFGDDAAQKSICKQVSSKRRCHSRLAPAAPVPLDATARRLKGLIARRFSAKRLTHRRSHGFHYRKERLKRAAAFKAEDDLEWLQWHQNRLATIVARQDLHALLREGLSSALIPQF